MLTRLRLALLLPAAALIGCAAATSSPSGNTPITPTGDWTNWQIQSGSAITTPPMNLYFIGAVETQGSQASAIFTSPTSSGTQVLDFTGTYNSSTQDLALTTDGYLYSIAFTEPSVPNTVTPMDVDGGCISAAPSGITCAVISQVPSVAVEIAPLNGTYTGTLTASSESDSGQTMLTLTQSTTPNSSGQFPLSGTIVLPGSLGTVPLAGTISGEAITLSDPSAAPNSPSINLAASTNPAATLITITNLTYSGSGTSATFTGTLTLQ